jgi:hypothetical protein
MSADSLSADILSDSGIVFVLGRKGGGGDS